MKSIIIACMLVMLGPMSACLTNAPPSEDVPATNHRAAAFNRALIERYALYRDPAPSSQKLERAVLTRFADEHQVLTEYLAQSLEPRDRALAAGLRWILSFIDDTRHLDPNFPLIAMLLYEMSVTKNLVQTRVAISALQKVLAYGLEHIDTLFRKNEKDRWEFIGLLRVVVRFPAILTDYHNAYRKLYGDSAAPPYQSNDMSFVEAIKRNAHVVIGDYVLYESFLYEYLRAQPTTTISLPKSNFLDVVSKLDQFDYGELPTETTQYIDLGYLATHVVLALSNYGMRPIGNNESRRKVESFIDRTYAKTRDMGYLDLFAEYVQCLKIMRPHDARIETDEALLTSFQRNNGSWGREEDFARDPYHAFHPTWAVLTALNQQPLAAAKKME